MEKKVGNRLISVFLLLICRSVFASDASIVLRMQDMNHASIDQAMSKAPFILQVELKNLEGYTDIHLMQYISGIENFKSSRCMTSHNVSIDGNKTVSKTFYNFVLRSDKKGKFTLGPVMLKDKTGASIYSNRLIIPVGDEVIASEENSKEKYFITTSLNKNKAYVGERITLVVKFFDRLFVDDLHLQFPNFSNLYVVRNQNNVRKSMVTIDDEEYSVTEWTFDMYVTQPETLIIQGINAVFVAPELENKFKLGGKFDFFRSIFKSEQYVTAQPLKVEVLPLPMYKGSCDIVAVGQFSKFEISVNQNSAPVGQGIALTTELWGDGNFEMLKPTQLVLPEGFKYYDSNMVTLDEKRSYKHADFIVQADTPGTYRIEPQQFIYFDPVEATYKKIQSNAVDITITPAIDASQSTYVSDSSDDEFDENEELGLKELKDFTLVEKGAVVAQLPIMIPLNWYSQLLWILFLMWTFLAMYRAALQKYIFSHPAWYKFVNFSQAEKAYKNACAKQEVYKLHQIFIQLFAYLTKVNAGQLHDEIIVQYLIDKDFSQQQIQSWKKFNKEILQASFSSRVQGEQKDLFAQALQWIQQLKERA